MASQPTNPEQICSVASGTGTLSGADINDVVVTCSTESFAVGGTVSDLVGTGLVLQLNGADDVTVDAAGDFSFATPVADGSAYEVTVLTQPTEPEQICAVSAESGTISGADVTDVMVACGAPNLGNRDGDERSDQPLAAARRGDRGGVGQWRLCVCRAGGGPGDL